MHPTILPQATGKIIGLTGFFNLGMATHLKEGKLISKELNLEIDHVAHPTGTEGLDKYIYIIIYQPLRSGRI